MRKDGLVSVWVGDAESEQRLLAFVDETHPDDPTVPISEFAGAIGVTYYDEDGREVIFLPAPATTLTEVLQEFSYSDRIIAELAELHGHRLSSGMNCACMLYDFAPEVAAPSADAPGVKLSFLGVVPYR